MAPTRSLASGIFGRLPLLLCLVFIMLTQLATGRSEPQPEPLLPPEEIYDARRDKADVARLPDFPPGESRKGVSTFAVQRHPAFIIIILSYTLAFALLFALAAILNRRSLKRKHLEDVERIRKDSMTELDKTKAELEKLRSELDALRDEVNTLKSRPEG